MNENFAQKAGLKSNEELHNRIDLREKYLPETVEAAVAELQKRGDKFSDDELKVIAEDIQARRDLAKTTPAGYGSFNKGDKARQIEDPDAPEFYSKGAIYGFSVLFSVLFGATLLAINVTKTQKKGKIIWILLYGIVFTAIQLIIVNAIKNNTGFAVVVGILGSYPLTSFFWSRTIGNATFYRAKPIWIPLIIAIVLLVLFLISLFS